MQWLDIRREERGVLAWAALWFYCVLAAYYTIRPVRETFATGLDSDQKATLFTWTLLVMLLATPLYGLLVARVSKRWLVPAVYGFFIVNLAVFGALIQGGEPPHWFAGAFFVWIGVFNLFVVMLLWSTLVDLFSGEQGKRLFGLIFGAGTLGQLTSSWAVQALVKPLGMQGLLWICITFLLIAIFCSWQIQRALTKSQPETRPASDAVSNAWSLAWQGVTAVIRSPYLLGIAGFIIAMSVCATFVYFQMTEIVAVELAEDEDRLRWFAKINAIHAGITLLMQTAVVAWLLRKIGVGLTLALVPAVLCLGFITLSVTQTLFAIGAFQIALRAAAFSLGNPSLEVLYTAVAPQQKYRAKAFVDTVGKRLGDVLGAQGAALLDRWGWLVSSVSLAMLPVAAGALVLCLLLGSAHRQATRR